MGCQSANEQIIQDIDALGLKCPEPVMLLHSAMRKIQGGERVRLVATDPSTERDVRNFCQFLGHELLHFDREDTRLIYVIQKRV